MSKVVVGDLIRYRSRHTVMVTGVFDDYFTVADCNYGYDCNITWDRKMQKSFFSPLGSGTFDGVYHCQINSTKQDADLDHDDYPKCGKSRDFAADRQCGLLFLRRDVGRQDHLYF